MSCAPVHRSAGKTFVLEYISSIDETSGAGGDITANETEFSHILWEVGEGSSLGHELPLVYAHQGVPDDHPAASEDIHFAIPAEATIRFEGIAINPANTCAFAVSIGGHLQPA